MRRTGGTCLVAAALLCGQAVAAPRPLTVACSGTTTARSMSAEKSDPFDAIFVFDDAARSWVRTDPASGAGRPICLADDCTVLFSPTQVVARSGTLVATFDRRRQTFSAGDLKDVDGTMVEIITRATCHAPRVPPARRP
ncbi:hypothetical protein [Gluconacetobacter johannae]|uniref:Uncharacterized protein n=1 Tax=Gluconacetobacter johannae TaxID=112140 RepID=A0A7W4P2J2_9PROT|nr:hypothetical protein [Gluconacetobacter johannae]MBB2175226.1 hypothetical protein [Gluconacetobacter johannae]